MNCSKQQWVKLVSYMATFDGGLYVKNRRDRPNNKNNAFFTMNMRKDNLDYVEWVSFTLEQVVGTKIYDRKDYNTDGQTRSGQVRLESKTHPKLTTIRDRIYTPDNKKVLDPHMLKMIDPESLSIIFMTDGGTYLDTRWKNPYPCLFLHTKGFSYHDNMALSKAIYEKLGIRTNISRHKNYYFLRVKTSDIKFFLDTVYPYTFESFRYKFERLAPAFAG